LKDASPWQWSRKSIHSLWILYSALSLFYSMWEGLTGLEFLPYEVFVVAAVDHGVDFAAVVSAEEPAAFGTGTEEEIGGFGFEENLWSVAAFDVQLRILWSFLTSVAKDASILRLKHPIACDER